MKKAPVQWLWLLLVIGLLLMPAMSAAAQSGGGTEIYLPFVAQAPPPQAVVRVGPAGGTFPAVAIDPTNTSVIYTGTWGLGVQKSLNGGLTWQPVNSGLENLYIQSLAMRPDGSALYAGTYGNGIYRSEDGGASWQAMNTGLIKEFIAYDIEIDPANSQRMFSAGRKQGTFVNGCCLYGLIYRSTDGGGNWTEVWNAMTPFPTRGDYSYDVDIDPNNSNTVYFTAHEHGVYQSTNGGDSWQAIQASPLELSARKLAINPNQSATLYNSTYNVVGLYKSTNGGSSWNASRYGLPGTVFGFALTLNPAAPDTLYLGTGANGVYKSTDGAASWSPSGLSSNFIWDIQLAADNPAHLFSGTGGNGLQYSSNGGASWEGRSEGIFNTNITAVVTLPGEPGTLYVGVRGGGVYQSLDRGGQWQALNNGLRDLNINWLFNQNNRLFAITDSSLFTLDSGASTWSEYAGPTVTTGSPPFDSAPANPASSDMPFLERILNPEEEFLLSGGETPVARNGILATTITKPVVSAAQISEGIYAGTAGAGVWLWNGAEWKACGYNDLADPRTLYSLFTNPYEIDSVYGSINLANSEGYLIIKRVNCRNWDAASNNAQIPFSVRTISFAASPARMYAATTNGIYSRPNGTTSWVHANGITGSVYDIAIDPANSNLLYAAASTGTYYSVDGGANWYFISRPELQGAGFLSVEVDRSDSNIVYFGSKEGSTYRWDRRLN